MLVCISGCSSPVKTAYSAPGLTESPPATAISIPSATPAAESVGLDCQEKFEQRALSGSSADGQAGGDPRQTMSAEDLSSSLVQMGIEKICLPTSLGAPFVAVDWDESQGPAEVGRMFSIGFEELYDGAGWGAGYLVYGEYAFSAGTEYEVFGREGDFQSLQGELPAGASEINGKTMLRKAVRSEIGFGRCAAYLVYLFPFESHYLAASIVLTLRTILVSIPGVLDPAVFLII